METRLAPDHFDPKQVLPCAAPDVAGMVFAERPGARVQDVRAGTKDGEEWAGGSIRIKAAQPALGGDPVGAIARNEQVINPVDGQPLGRGVVGEAVAVEARQPALGTEPQEAARGGD